MSVDRFKAACRIHTGFAVMRYLMANAEGRLNGFEKAEKHRELCSFYVAVTHECDPVEAMSKHPGAYQAVHRETQKLTDYLDEAIGFPLHGRPDYDALAPLFFERFHALALAALPAD